MIAFFVPGNPVPYARTSGGKTMHRFTPAKQRDYMPHVRLAASQALRGKPPIEGAVSLTVKFIFARPKNHFTKKGLRPDAPQLHTARPDASNLVKLIEDALNGVAWRDDAQIAVLMASKIYGETPGVEVKIEEA